MARAKTQPSFNENKGGLDKSWNDNNYSEWIKIFTFNQSLELQGAGQNTH